MRAEVHPLEMTQGASAHMVTCAVIWFLRCMGWGLCKVDRRLSWANPLTKRVEIGAMVERDDASMARLLVHELTHARQQGRGFWRRFAWLCWYYLSRSFRLRVEVEARAHALLCRARMCRSMEVGLAVADAKVEAGALAGWRWPYLTGADETKVCQRIRKRLAELAREMED